jgi:hypothetical protein
VPWGYTLAIVALPMAAISGPADELWHRIYGFENQIDAPFSPSHQGLFFSGALLAGIPVASAWQRRGVSPRLVELLPALVSMSSVLGFVIHQMLPFFSVGAMGEAFQLDIAGRAEAYGGGSGAIHTEGLSPAIHNFGDEAFPYYFYSTLTTMAGVLLFTAILMGAVLLMRRRWELPFGSLTVVFTWHAVLYPLLSEYREWQQAVPLILAGILGDLLLAGWVGKSGRATVGRVRAFAAVMPLALWGMFLVSVEVAKGGLGWSPTLWVGVLTTTMGLGYVLSFLVFPPFMPVDEQVPPAAEG